MNPLGVLNEVINKQLGFDDNELLDVGYESDIDEGDNRPHQNSEHYN